MLIELWNFKPQGNLEILENSECGKLKLSSTITPLIRGRAQMRTQVSWLSSQTSFQDHFSNSSIGSLIKLCAPSCLWFETWASWYRSFSGVRVVGWPALMEGRQSPGHMEGSNFLSREGFHIEAKGTGPQQAIREEQWVMETGIKKCQEAPELGPDEETWSLCMFPLPGAACLGYTPPHFRCGS